MFTRSCTLLALLLAPLALADDFDLLRVRAEGRIVASRALQDVDLRVNEVLSRNTLFPSTRTMVFEQWYKDVPVKGGAVFVTFDESGEPALALDRVVRGLDLDARPRFTSYDAKEIARKAMPKSDVGEPVLWVVPRNSLSFLSQHVNVPDRDHLGWELAVQDGAKSWLLYVDGQSGDVFAKILTIGCPGPPPLHLAK